MASVDAGQYSLSSDEKLEFECTREKMTYWCERPNIFARNVQNTSVRLVNRHCMVD